MKNSQTSQCGKEIYIIQMEGGKENSDEQKALLLCLFVCLLFDMIKTI